MTAYEIYEGSNGMWTKDLYAELAQLGPLGVVALNLFRSQKCSTRAKGYSRRYKGAAYDRKNWSMANLCVALGTHGDALGIRWGWKEDPTQEYHRWVLYVDIPTGQMSFHSVTRGLGPDYPGDWDGQTNACAMRICRWVDQLLQPEAVS